MTQEEERILHQFEARVRTLIEKFRVLKQENEELYTLVEEHERKLKAMEESKKATEELMDNYKAGRMLELSSGDIEEARKRVAAMIREVDKCISLLNV